MMNLHFQSRRHEGIRRLLGAILLLSLACAGFAQVAPGERAAFDRAEAQGVPVQIRTISQFQGVAPNQLVGIGLVTGLGGTGDTKNFLATQRAAINLLRKYNTDVDITASESKNIALVTLTAEIPAFSSPGNRIDVTASAIGDCTSLRGGTLLFTPLNFPGNPKTFATVSGSVSVGGFAAGAGGNSTQQGFVTVGKLPSAGLILENVPTETVFAGKMYLNLSDADATTALRVEEAIRKTYPEFAPTARGAGSIELSLPPGMNPNTAQARIGALTVMADTEAKVVIDEKTGTVVIGGNVRVAPCAFAKGSLTIRITDEPFVSQPAPDSRGKTKVLHQKTLDAKEGTAQIAVLRPNTTVADLAAIFQALHLKADDVINILRSLHEEGALKARLEVH